jgi:hypothetical protein
LWFSVVKIDADLCHQFIVGALDDFYSIAPGQKLGIILDFGDQIEHLFCAIAE